MRRGDDGSAPQQRPACSPCPRSARSRRSSLSSISIVDHRSRSSIPGNARHVTNLEVDSPLIDAARFDPQSHAQATEGAPVDDQLAKAIAMDSCREMLGGIADADVNLFTPKERQLLDRAATGDATLRTQAETIQERRRTEWSSWRANAANEVVREVAPVYRAVDLGDSGPPRWRTFARKRLLELARELGPAAIEEILPGTRAGDLRSAKYVEAATTGWPP